MPSQLQTNISRTQIQREKMRTLDLTRFDNLPTSMGQKGEDLIQSTKLQGLQSDSKIQLIKIDPNRETTQFAVEIFQTN